MTRLDSTTKLLPRAISIHEKFSPTKITCYTVFQTVLESEQQIDIILTFYFADICSVLHSCGECIEHEECFWLKESFRCVHSNLSSATECSNPQNPTDVCSDYKHCESCYAHGCSWNGSHCYSQSKFKGISPCSELFEFCIILNYKPCTLVPPLQG